MKRTNRTEFLDEARRRNVHRVALAYIAASWLLIQVVETLMPAFDWSPQVLRVLLILLVIGFVPAMVIAWIFEWTPEGWKRESGLKSQASRPDSRNFDRFIAAVLALAVAYFAIDKFVLDPARDEASLEAAREEAARRALSGEFADAYADRSILVTPFVNLSPDPEQAYFADGLAGELLNRLAQMETLRVISRSTAWTFKDQVIDVDDIHRKLGVSYILEGSVQKTGEKVRVTTSLVDARTNTNVWSETYDRLFDDVLAIQDDIALAVAEEMHLELIVPGSPHEGIDPRAYELFLRADVDPARGIGGREREAIDLLEEAVRIEPEYLPAISGLAYAYYFSPTESAEEANNRRQQVLALVDRMTTLAPESVYVSNWLGWIALRWENDPVAAAPHLEQSMRYANRTDLHVYFRGAMLLLHLLGRDEEARVVGQYWINRDPACVSCLGGVAGTLREAGRYEDAIRIMESAPEWVEWRTPEYWNLGVSALHEGDAQKALHYFEQIPEGDTRMDREFARAFALASLGRREEFDEIVAQKIAEGTGPEFIARLYAWSDQPDLAFEWLERMAQEYGPVSVQGVRRVDLYRPIQADPRWNEFLEKYGAAEEPVRNFSFDPEYPPILQRAIDAVRNNR